MALSTRNITKEIVDRLEPAQTPEIGTLLEARVGKVSKLGDKIRGEQSSAIYKKKRSGRIFVGETGLSGDEHVYRNHGGIERAVNQYASEHYVDWRCEDSPKPELFQYGGFGENLVGTNMNEDNVCIGDLYRIGSQVILQVSEPRSPCNKLNIRFQWPRALKRIQRTGRVGWNYRVRQTGYIEPGDSIVLIDRPHPQWSLTNVKRVIQGKNSPLYLLQELADLTVMTEMIRNMAAKRLESAPKVYELTKSEYTASRVKHLTFTLKEGIKLSQPNFKIFAFAQVQFGNDPEFKRSYSIVSGDMNEFTLGVALNDHSRGGSAYLHKRLHIGDRIQMFPGSNPNSVENEEKCIQEKCIDRRIVVIGGIGVTAFLPLLKQWESEGQSYEIHYACRSAEQAAFLDQLNPQRTTLYAKSENSRLSVDNVIPTVPSDQQYRSKIYCCGPTGLMNACRERAEVLGYPKHMLHFESFGANTNDNEREPFEAGVHDLDSGRSVKLIVPTDRTLLQVLREAGFDMTSFCESGGCGACKVTVCKGKIKHNSNALAANERDSAMLSCVDQGIGKIEIELD